MANIYGVLFDSDWQQLGKCKLPGNGKDIDDLKCVVNYSGIESENYFVCVYANNF